MKILLAHNFYGSATPSGENQVVIAEQAMLRARGHAVSLFGRYSDQIRAQGALGAVKGALATPWNPLAARALQQACTAFAPDVVHVHNTFPLISPSIFSAIGQRAARVLTLHNYRLFCPAAIPMRSSQVCTDCLDRRSAMPAVVHGCYRQSRVASVPLALGVALHRALGTWTRQVDAFICLSAFQRELMVKAGLPREKVHVKPNFYPSMPAVLPWAQRAPYVVFAGRLTPEKGVENLLRAWQQWGDAAPELRIVGDGPLRAALEQRARSLPVRFLGQLDAQAAQQQIAHARLLVLPSEWFETFGLVVVEAFAFGTPCAVSNLGPLPSIVEHGHSGVVFPPAQPAALLAQVRAAWEAPGQLEQLGQGARQAFEQHYTEAANHAALMNIYQQAIEVARHE